jgi:hypothetical protein
MTIKQSYGREKDFYMDGGKFYNLPTPTIRVYKIRGDSLGIAVVLGKLGDV